MSEIKTIIDKLDALIPDVRKGLPEDVFLLVSRLTPLFNVDLLIKNDRNQTLLTWRDDSYDRPGWHVPGGIVRCKEKMADRIHAVAGNELGAGVSFEPAPLAINEIMHATRMVRGHFISFLFSCCLIGEPDEKLRYVSGLPRPGEWAWHGVCPEDILPVHRIYSEFF